MDSNNNNESPLVVTQETIDQINAKAEAFGKPWSEYINNNLPIPNVPLPFSNNHNNNNNVNNNYHSSELEKQIEKQQKESIRLQRKYQETVIERDKLRVVVRGLTQFINEGPKPRFNAVAMMKPEQCPWSKKINEIKQYLAKQHKLLICHKLDNKTKHIDIEASIYKNDNGWISDAALKDRINSHIIHNGEHNSNPQIFIKKTANKRRKNRKVTASLNVSTCDKMQASELMQTFKIGQHRVASLESKLGVRLTKKAVSAGTVLGEYTGNRYLENEFEKIFGQCYDYQIRNMYAFETSVYVPHDIDGEDDMKMDDKEKKVVIIDGWEQRKKNMLIYINDCRKNINVKEVSAEDEKYWNCSFKTALIDGFPAVFVIARRDIKIGEELNVFYGDNYGKSVQQKHDYDETMAKIAGLVDGTILKILGPISEFDDVYIIE